MRVRDSSVGVALATLATLATLGTLGTMFSTLSWQHIVRPAYAQRSASQTPELPTAKTVWSGVYTREQAARGKAVYDLYCTGCHGPDLGGVEGPPLVGGDFLRNWLEDDVRSLFDKLQARMPADAPGTLSGAETADIVSYLFQENEFPPGPEDLRPDAATLSAIRIEGKDGPAPVPNFSLVLVVGCLTQTGDAQWTVTRATEPVRTRESAPRLQTPDMPTVPLGTQTFRLIDATSSRPETHKDHKVEVKGLLMRQPTGTSLNVTSIQAVASSCS